MLSNLIQTLKEKFMPTPTELSPVEKYRLHRIELEKHFIPDNVCGKPKEVKSPSGRYLLRVTTYKTKEGCWNYSRGEVFDGEKLVADVKLNYHDFPFAWAEQHPNGHDYLLACEDYQGYSVVELDTGRREDLLPNAELKGVALMGNGFGFCWVRISPSPDKKVLAVDGCYWACPYEVVLFDFREPMKLPLPELERWDDVEEFDAWKTEGKLLLSRTVEVRKSDGKMLYDLPDEEMEKAEAAGDVEEKRLTRLWEPRSLTEVRP